MRDDLINSRPRWAVGNARAGRPIPLERAVLKDLCPLLADADHDTFIRYNRIG